MAAVGLASLVGLGLGYCLSKQQEKIIESTRVEKTSGKTSETAIRVTVTGAAGQIGSYVSNLIA